MEHTVYLHATECYSACRSDQLEHFMQDLLNKVFCDQSSRECMIDHCEKCPGTAALKTFLDYELDEFEPDS